MKTKYCKILLFILMFLSLVVLSSCSNLSGYSASTALTGVQEVNISSTKLNLNIDTTVNCSFEQYFNSSFDATVVNEDLKKWCFTSLMDAHDIGIADLKARPNTSTNTTVREQSFYFLNQLGFEDIVGLTIGSNATTDTDDTCKIVYSEKSLSAVNGKGRYVINLSICGADSASDWISNFDIGSTVSGYGGNHPDWTNKDNHKGYDVAATRVIEFLKEELRKTKYNNGQYLILVSGYSRGAAVANLVAQKLVDNPTYVREKGFTLVNYNFATPNSTTSTTCRDAKYNCIHNYINTDDIINYLPPSTESMNFQRYGQDHTFTISTSQELITRVEAIANNKYDTSCVPACIQAIKNMSSTRDGFYSVIEDEAHKTWSCKHTDCDTQEQAMADYQEFIDGMALAGLDKYFSFAGLTEGQKSGYKDDGDGIYLANDIPYYTWHCYVGEGLVLKVFSSVMTKVFCGDIENALHDRPLLNYTKYSNDFQVIINSISACPDFYSDAHFPQAYFVGCFEK